MFWILAVLVVLAFDSALAKTDSVYTKGPESQNQTLIAIDFSDTSGSFSQKALQMAFLPEPAFLLDGYPDPDEYLIGPGDKFDVLFVSDELDDQSCLVGADGAIFVKTVGPVYLGQVTLGDALARIEQAVAAAYNREGFHVRLGGCRFVRINVTGEVAHPGIYYAPAFWRVSEVIALAGGLLPEGSWRRINLSGAGSDIGVDLIRYNALGDKAANPFICKGTSVSVPRLAGAGSFIAVSGEVIRPGVFEAAAGDRLSDLVEYAGGLNGEAADLSVQWLNASGNEVKTLSGDQLSAADRFLNAGDVVRVAWKSDRPFRGTFTIFGEVQRPGKYYISGENFSLEEALALAGGLTSKAGAEVIQVYRQVHYYPTGAASDSITCDRVRPGGRRPLSLNPRQPIPWNEIGVAANDSIYVPELTGLVSVVGAVGAPGLVPFTAGKSAEYYIGRAGGFGAGADRQKAWVFNPVTGGKIVAAAAGALLDGEVIMVPQKEGQARP